MSEHNHEHCDCGHDHEEERRPELTLDAQREATLAGLVGALVDLGIVPFGEMRATYAALGLDVEPEFEVDVVKACRGIRVSVREGSRRSLDELKACLDRLPNEYGAAREHVLAVYRLVENVCKEEQGTEEPDLGSFLSTDVFGLLVLASIMLTASGTEGLVATELELGNVEYEERGRIVSAPASLAARFAEGTVVRSTAGARGIDVPTAALAASCLIEQTRGIEGVLGAVGYGLDGGAVTRVFLTERI